MPPGAAPYHEVHVSETQRRELVHGTEDLASRPVAVSGEGSSAEAAPGEVGLLAAAVARLREAVDAVLACDLDACSEAEVEASLAVVQASIGRLTGFRARGTGLLESRAVRAAGPGRERAALRIVRDELAAELRLPASEIRKDGRTGRRVAELPAVREAMASGALPGSHAVVLADTLRLIDDPAVRDEAEARLLAIAADHDVRAFCRAARAVLVELDAAAAQRRIDRQHARRELRLAMDADGTLQVHGNGAGLDAEVVQTAIHSFRVHDAAGQRRTPGQRTWDAFVRVCEAALDAGAAATDRGVRPHVLITVAEPVVADRDGSGNGVAEAAWSGALPYSEVRRLLADAGVSRVLVDARGLPVEAGEAVRTVPAAVRKGVLVRDKVCIADGCDVPAAWCDVMHLEVPYHLAGRLSMTTAGLGCRYHHRLFDLKGWTVTVVDGRPVLHHPDRPPRAGPPRAGPPPAGPARAGPSP